MLSKQVETAIERTKFIEKIVHREKYNSGKKLFDLISREIQVPLNIINNYTEILSQKDLPADADDIIRMLQKQAYSVEDIADTLFHVTINSEIKIDGSEVHFNELIEDILELLSEYCEAREVKLYKKIGDGAIVNIDRSKFYTAIFQMIKASCDDSRKEGRIYFSTEFSDGMIVITIQNEGKGILTEPAGDLPDFLYSERVLGEDELGLLLARKIIQSHSGQIHLESIKGNGSTFRITLPVIQTEETEN
jgi:signal transduction histidine kinase